MTVGAVGRPSKKLSLFSQISVDPANKTDFLGGFRARFMSSMLTGTMSSSGKLTSIFKKPAEPLNTTWTGIVDFSKP